MATSMFYLVCFAIFGFVQCDQELNAKLRYYFSSIDHYTELPFNQADQIFATSWYQPDYTTIIFAHGFTGYPKGPAVAAVVEAYLQLGHYNVVLLNWEQLAAAVTTSLASSYVNWAAPNARKLGVEFSEVLYNMSLAGLDLNKTHLVGHSLGAHLFGIAGNRLVERGILLPWITGLDPASVGFENRPNLPRLNARSAKFVSVIHSDPSKYGFSKPLGTVDFWPNFKPGTVTQPGCDSRPYPMFSPEDICNHNRCWRLLIDALKYPGSIIGSYAKNFRIWRNYSDKERNFIILDIATFSTQIRPGNYYFITKSASPFGLGEKGLYL